MVREILCYMSKSDDSAIPKFIRGDLEFDVAWSFASQQLQFIHGMLFSEGAQNQVPDPVEYSWGGVPLAYLIDCLVNSCVLKIRETARTEQLICVNNR